MCPTHAKAAKVSLGGLDTRLDGRRGGRRERRRALVDQNGGDRQRLSAEERRGHRHVLENTHVDFLCLCAQGNASEGGGDGRCPATKREISLTKYYFKCE